MKKVLKLLQKRLSLCYTVGVNKQRKTHTGVGNILNDDMALISSAGESASGIEIDLGGFVKSSMTPEPEIPQNLFTLIYVWKGSVSVTLGSYEHSLFAGDLFVCRPWELKALSLSDASAEYYWIGFSGRNAAKLLSSLKFTSKDKYFVGHEAAISTLLDRTLAELHSDEPFSNVIASSFLQAALGIMSRLAIHLIPSVPAKDHDKIAPALASINSDCTSKLTVDDYAKLCNLSTSYFTHLFTKSTGFSPMEYKQLQRINIAKNLLSTTNLSIKEISTIIGYKDPLYFGRCFKQTTGYTPTGYRAAK